MTYYRIVYNLEHQYKTLQNAKRANAAGTWLLPTIPHNAMMEEDCTTERVCVAKRIEDCITSLRVLGPFKRCLAANEDAKSYAEAMNEAYPILVLEIDTDEIPVSPTEEQVPDIELTHELWFTRPVRVSRCSVKWLDCFSIEYDDSHIASIRDKSHGFPVCKSIRFLEDAHGHDHPWLNGRGHILASDLMDWEPESYPFLTPEPNPSAIHATRISDNFRIEIPQQLREAECLSPGETVWFRCNETEWMSVMDERGQAAIPEDAVKACCLKDNSTVSMQLSARCRFEITNRLAWTDMSERGGRLLSMLSMEGAELKIVKEPFGDAHVEYVAELRVFEPEWFSWRYTFGILPTSESERISLPAMQCKALRTMNDAIAGELYDARIKLEKYGALKRILDELR